MGSKPDCVVLNSTTPFLIVFHNVLIVLQKVCIVFQKVCIVFQKVCIVFRKCALYFRKCALYFRKCAMGIILQLTLLILSLPTLKYINSFLPASDKPLFTQHCRACRMTNFYSYNTVFFTATRATNLCSYNSLHCHIACDSVV